MPRVVTPEAESGGRRPVKEAAWAFRTAEFPRTFAPSPDGKWLAIGTDAGTLRLHRLADGGEHRVLSLHEGAITSLAWNPREPLLATAGEDGAVLMLDLRTGEPETIVAPGETWAELVAWNAKGSKLAGAVGRSVTVYARDRRTHTSCGPVESTVAGLAFSADGEHVAVACYGGVRLFDPKTGRRTRSLDWKGSMVSLAWNPNGKIIACGCQDGSVHFWRLPAGKDSMMSGYPSKPKEIAWSHDGKLLATGGAAECTVWSFAGKGPEGSEPTVLSGHDEPITAMAFAPMVGVLATGARNGEILLWAPDEHPRPVRRHGLGARVETLAWAVALEQQNLLLIGCDAEGAVAAWPFR